MLTFHFSVFDAKHLIGRKSSSAEIQSSIKCFPSKAIDKTGKSYVGSNTVAKIRNP